MGIQKHVEIIAEIGVNHNGDLLTALKMIDAAAEAGADTVKFQTFIARLGVSQQAEKAGYQKETTGQSESQLEMVQKLEIDRDFHIKLMEHCEKREINFLSTACDLPSVDLLESLNVAAYKIASCDMVNTPLLRAVAKTGKPLYLATGMADLQEVEQSLNILQEAGLSRKKIVLLHCNTEYPTPAKDANLRAIDTLKEHFGTTVGYSDHTQGIIVPLSAAARGASVIEKHFTLDKKQDGPDHRASADPKDLKELVKAIRTLELALGDGIKRPSESECRNIPVMRRSIVAARQIQQGEVFDENNLLVKRPGTGINPLRWDTVVGKTAKRIFSEDEPIEL